MPTDWRLDEFGRCVPPGVTDHAWPTYSLEGYCDRRAQPPRRDCQLQAIEHGVETWRCAEPLPEPGFTLSLTCGMILLAILARWKDRD